MKQCPACGSTNVRRSTIRASERGAHAFRSPYRCEACRARYWVLSRKVRLGVVAAGASVLTVALLATAAALLIRYAARPPEMTAVDFPPETGGVRLPVAAMPDQVVNETRRFELMSTGAMPIADPGRADESER